MLVHRIPYPPNKGDKIRSYHLLKHLSERYRVHLATFVDDADDWRHVSRVQALCFQSYFAPLRPFTARLRSLAALLTGRSLSLGYYRSREMRAWVDDVVQKHGIKRIVVFSSAMAQYAPPSAGARRIVDFVDVDSDKWRQYAATKRWPISWLYCHEARQLLAYERRIARECDAALFVSKPEADLFRSLAPESARRIGYVNNGVDTDYFSPQHAYQCPYSADQLAVVFTGAMDYWPNIDAVQWFATEIFPAVLKAHPAARFYIVGARPSDAVLALARQEAVVVTGTVSDVRPYLAYAALAVAPLRVARGIQNKVLEAMAMARTVVVSPQALEGIDATAGCDLLLADGAQQFCEIVKAALSAPDSQRGLVARATVKASYSWPTNLASIDRLLEATPSTPAHMDSDLPSLQPTAEKCS